jgi:hypothetical protein
VAKYALRHQIWEWHGCEYARSAVNGSNNAVRPGEYYHATNTSRLPAGTA